MQGYQASCLQNGGCSIQKENTLNKCSKQDFVSITWYSGTDTQGSHEFSKLFIWMVWYGSDIESLHVCNLQTIHCVLPSDPPAKSSWWSPLSQLVNFAGSRHLVITPVIGASYLLWPIVIMPLSSHTVKSSFQAQQVIELPPVYWLRSFPISVVKVFCPQRLENGRINPKQNPKPGGLGSPKATLSVTFETIGCENPNWHSSWNHQHV